MYVLYKFDEPFQKLSQDSSWLLHSNVFHELVNKKIFWDREGCLNVMLYWLCNPSFWVYLTLVISSVKSWYFRSQFQWSRQNYTSAPVTSYTCWKCKTSSYPGWIKSPHVVTLRILKLSDLDSLTIFIGGGIPE